MKPETEYKIKAYFMRLMIAVCIALLFIVVINMAHAEDIIVYQTMPGNANQINREAPKLIIKDNGTAYYTIPGGSGRDYTRPAYRITGGDNNAIGTFGTEYRTDFEVSEKLLHVRPAQDGARTP